MILIFNTLKVEQSLNIQSIHYILIHRLFKRFSATNYFLNIFLSWSSQFSSMIIWWSNLFFIWTWIRVFPILCFFISSLVDQIINPSSAEATFVQSSTTQDFWKPSKHCCVSIQWIAVTEYSQMSTHIPRVQSLFRLFVSFSIAQISHLA